MGDVMRHPRGFQREEKIMVKQSWLFVGRRRESIIQQSSLFPYHHQPAVASGESWWYIDRASAKDSFEARWR